MSGWSRKTQERLLYLASPIGLLLIWQLLLMAGFGDRCVIMTAQPGRLKQVIDVPFPHPRDLIALSAAAEFGRLKLDIWRVLEEEVTRARAEEKP